MGVGELGCWGEPGRLAPKSDQNLSKNLCLWGSNLGPGGQSMRVARAAEIGQIADCGMPRCTSCKPKGLCFTHGEESLTLLIFYIVYVYDRATLDRATL